MANKNTRFLLAQKIIVGAIGVLVLVLFGVLYSMVITEAPLGDFVEGEHYVVIENPRRIRGDKIEIMEFFSYACVHCYNFDPKLNDWVAENKDKIRFVRTPAVGNNYWRILARAYYTMEELGILEDNHAALFRAIHEMNRPLDSAEQLASWFDGKGTTAEAFRSMFDSPLIDRKMEIADQLARRLRIISVPSIFVNGKYTVRITSEVGPSRMLDVMDHLVEKELTGTGEAPAG